MARNLVRRPDGHVINARAPRGMLFVCATGCCCGHTEKDFAPVLTDVYQTEWEHRKLRNHIHLNQGGCLGPCQLANVVLVLFDGHPLWFHSINSADLIIALYDYIEVLLRVPTLVPPGTPLAELAFNGFAWGHHPVLPQRLNWWAQLAQRRRERREAAGASHA